MSSALFPASARPCMPHCDIPTPCPKPRPVKMKRAGGGGRRAGALELAGPLVVEVGHALDLAAAALLDREERAHQAEVVAAAVLADVARAGGPDHARRE